MERLRHFSSAAFFFVEIFLISRSCKKFYIRPEKNDKNEQNDVIIRVSGLTFEWGRCKLPVETNSAPVEARSKLIFNRISSKEYENRPSFVKILLIPCSKYQQEHCASVSAGRFSIVTESGSWSDLHTRAWGSVRLFLCSDVKNLTSAI